VLLCACGSSSTKKTAASSGAPEGSTALSQVTASRPNDPHSTPSTPSMFDHSSIYQRFAVAADHPLASKAGAEMLRRGGNAVDAAVAASFALSVVRPYSCGIGGGGFMVIRLPRSTRHPEGVLTSVNYREWGINAQHKDYFENISDPDAPTHGGKAVCVPGTVAGLLYCLEKYGTLSREVVLAPAILLAEQGFAADEHYVQSARTDELVLPWLLKDPARQARFGFLWDRFLARGEIRKGNIIKLPEQARALRLIARDGAAAFYTGDIARAIVSAVRSDGGEMTMEDLAGYRVEELPPLVATFGGGQLVTMPPPSSGGIVMAQALRMLEKLPQHLEAATRAGRDSPEYVHLIAEISKHAFADRARWMGDPNFVKVPTAQLLSDNYITSRAAAFNPAHVLAHDAYGTSVPFPADGGTSHLSVIDADGGAVACTETVNLIFGSLLCVDEYGFVLNNEMDDFITRSGQPNAFGLSHADLNRPAPRKRPLSSMTPSMVVRDGDVVLIAGGAGGPRIISGTLQASLNVLLFDDSAAAALGRARFHHQWEPDTLQLEPSLLQQRDLVRGLTDRGHTVVERKSIASVQLIRRGVYGIEAGSDPRKGGVPDGE
jgi:gamma-glutamyltranspeptidase/glutathione hydrolase